MTASPASRAAKVVTLAPARPGAAPAPAVVPRMVQLTLQEKRTGMRGSSEVPPASGDPSPWHQASKLQPPINKNSPNRRDPYPNIIIYTQNARIL